MKDPKWQLIWTGEGTEPVNDDAVVTVTPEGLMLPPVGYEMVPLGGMPYKTAKQLVEVERKILFLLVVSNALAISLALAALVIR